MYVTALASYVGSVLNYVCGIRDFHQRHKWQTVASGSVLVISATSGRMLHMVPPTRRSPECFQGPHESSIQGMHFVVAVRWEANDLNMILLS
jgi:hypothetical protein